MEVRVWDGAPFPTPTPKSAKGGTPVKLLALLCVLGSDCKKKNSWDNSLTLAVHNE